MPPLKVTKDDIVGDLAALGVPKGGLLFVHSSLSAIGEVRGRGRRRRRRAPRGARAGRHACRPDLHLRRPARLPRLHQSQLDIRPCQHPLRHGCRHKHRPHARGRLAERPPLAQRCRYRTARGNGRDRQRQDMGVRLGREQPHGVDVQQRRVNPDARRPVPEPDCHTRLGGRVRRGLPRDVLRHSPHPLARRGRSCPLPAKYTPEGTGTPAATSTASASAWKTWDSLASDTWATPSPASSPPPTRTKMARTMYEEDKAAFLKQGDGITKLSYAHTISNVKGTQCVVDPTKAFPTPPATEEHVA